MTHIINAPRATVESAEALAVVIVAKLASSGSRTVAVCAGTRTSDNAFVVALAAKLISSCSGSVAVSAGTRNSDYAFVLGIVAKLDIGVAIAA